MEIIIARNTGLCYGVKRALKIARDTRRDRSGRVATLGDLIHNPRVIADLAGCGVESAPDASALPPAGTVIIRSHGVSPDVPRALRRRRLEVVDATCPIVKNIQRLVARLARSRREIVIVGNRAHPESQGLIGHSAGRGVVVESEAEAAALPVRRRRAVLAQSTEDPDLFRRVVGALIDRTAELEVHDTICRSTRTRQRSTSELAGRVQALFVVGGRASSNTRQLYEIAKRIQPRTYFIESADQIRPAMLRGAHIIGISGGASTPPEAIEDAVRRIERSFERSRERSAERSFDAPSQKESRTP